MTIDERLEALTHNLELLSLESEKHDHQLDRAAKLITEVAEGTARLLRVVEMHEHRLDSHDHRLDKLRVNEGLWEKVILISIFGRHRCGLHRSMLQACSGNRI
jgi:hypothetical protein